MHTKEISHGVHKASSGIADLFVPWQWTKGTISEFLNAETDDEREVLTNLFVSSTLSNYNAIGLTSALVAGVISSAFSWSDVPSSHWSVKACWYSGLVFAFASISATGLGIAALLRLQCHTQSIERIQNVVGYRKPRSKTWYPRSLQPWIWGTPGLLLKLSLLFFLIGLTIHIWHVAAVLGKRWESDDLKIAIFVTTAAVAALLLYVIAVVGLFYRSVGREKEEE